MALIPHKHYAPCISLLSDDCTALGILACTHWSVSLISTCDPKSKIRMVSNWSWISAIQYCLPHCARDKKNNQIQKRKCQICVSPDLVIIRRVLRRDAVQLATTVPRLCRIVVLFSVSIIIAIARLKAPALMLVQETQEPRPGAVQNRSVIQPFEIQAINICGSKVNDDRHSCSDGIPFWLSEFLMTAPTAKVVQDQVIWLILVLCSAYIFDYPVVAFSPFNKDTAAHWPHWSEHFAPY